MKRAKTIVVKFDNGTLATVAVKLQGKKNLTRDESQHQFDTLMENLISASKSIPYASDATYRNISIR